jgi:hypothetical protein
VPLTGGAADRIFIMALVFEAMALAAPEVRSAVEDPTSMLTARACEPLTAPAKLRRCLGERDQINDVPPIATTGTCAIDQAEARRFDDIANRRVLFAMTAPGELTAVADCQRVSLAQEGEVDTEEVLALIDKKPIACTAP